VARGACHLDSRFDAHHDANVRTTVTLDPDVAAKLKELAHRRRISFKQALNDALRRGLVARPRGEPRRPFRVQAHKGGFRPGVDPAKLNQLLDELEVEDFAREASGAS
jgi:hypothetical protein